MDEGIAVIGVGCRFPGAPNPAAFWRNLQAGADTLTRFDTDELIAAGVDPELISRPEYVPIHGTLPDGELFDWRYFGYSRAEAAMIDPQQRVFLEVCVAALQDAALDPVRFPGWIGVFAGCDANTIPLDGNSPDIMGQLVGKEKDFLCSRVAYKLRLRGPAFTVQAACATSLVAVHQAVLSLRNHECDAALAGGGSLYLPQAWGYLYQEGHILSPDGRCRPFDADSAGTVPSNGIGAVVLRRLSDALEDGDRIMAVLRGSAVNNDGGEAFGFTAPSVTGQRDAVRLALAQADVDPDDIQHVEAHGTATQIGDRVEVAALTAAYRQSTDRIGYCWLSSVKSNVGHLSSGAGVAGVIKTALMLEHRELVPTAHFRRANPELNLAESPFRVTTERMRLDPDRPMLAAVSSFGAGGTNAHAVMESRPRSTSGRGPRVLCLSAPSAGSLRRARRELADRLVGENAPDPVSAAWTLVKGRPSFPHRVSVVAEDLGQAAAELLAENRPSTDTGVDTARAAFVFPGQGALYPGAATAAYELLPVFRELFDEATALTRRLWDIDLGIALRPDADAAPLQRAVVHQLGLFAIGYGLGRQLLEWGIRPVATLGNSAGEYVAAAVAGVWDLADGLRVVAERAGAMDHGPVGRMIAVYASLSEFEPLLQGRGLSLATVSPGQVLLSGAPGRAEELAADLESREVPHALLDIFVPAHTEGMRPVAGPLCAALAASAPRIAELPLVSNLTGQVIEPERLLDPGYWADQMCSQVRLGDGMTSLLALGCDVVIEVGPGHAMTGGLRRHPDWAGAHRAIPLLGRLGEPRRETLLSALGRLWEAGLPVEWESLFAQPPTPSALPPVPLDSEPCPTPQDASGLTVSRGPVRSPSAVPADVPAHFDPAPSASAAGAGGSASAPPENATLDELWCHALGVSSAQPRDNFYLLGGESLGLIHLLGWVRKSTGVRVPLTEFAEQPTFGVLTELVSRAERDLLHLAEV